MLLNANNRKARIAEKRRIILGFLRDETWSHISVLQLLLGFSTVQAAYQTLSKMERDKLVKRAEIHVNHGRSVSIWGITETGLHYAFSLDEPLLERKVFEPSKVKPLMMGHKIDLQFVRVKAESNDWKNWIPGELLGKRIKCAKYPDAIAINAKGERIAVELERTIKSRKRYSEILVSHLAQRKKGNWEKIYYLSPGEDLARRINRAFRSIRHASYNHRKIILTEDHFQPFYFYSFREDDWI